MKNIIFFCSLLLNKLLFFIFSMTEKKIVNRKQKRVSKFQKVQTGGFDLTQEQKQVIFRSTEKCLTQKGIILYHYMGSGKTLSSLHIMFHENFKNNEKMLFCDENIKENAWIPDAKKIKQKQNSSIKKNTEMNDEINKIHHSYDDFFSSEIDFNNKVIVIDEAHNISKRIRNKATSDKFNIALFIDKISTCKKIILLTGTPIYEDLSDLVILVNIAAGNGSYIPYQDKIFFNFFFNLSPSVKFLFQHLVPNVSFILQNIKKVFNLYNPLSITLFLQSLLFSFIKTGNSQINSHITQNLKNKKLLLSQLFVYIFAIVSKKMNNQNITSFVLNRLNTENILKYISPYIDYYKPDVLPRKEFETIYVSYNFYQIFEWFKIYMGIFTDPNVLKENNKQDVSHFNFFSSSSLEEKFENEARTIGNIKYDKRKVLNEFENKFFHQGSNLTKRLQSHAETIGKGYDNILFFAINFLTGSNLSMYDDVKKENILKKKKEQEQLIEDYNKEIKGQVKSNNTHQNKVSNKDQNIFNLFKEGITNVLTKNSFFSEIPNKFKKLHEYILNNRGNHLIYSNFYEKGGFLLFKYLKEQTDIKDKVEIYSKQDSNTHKNIEWFSNDDNNINRKEIKILILSPDSSEGISINNTNYYHILEPILEFSKREQVIGRAIRMNSHDNIPIENRYVKIIDWICKLDQDNIVNNIMQMNNVGFVEQIKFWLYGTFYSGDVLPSKFFEDAKFPFYTPDELVAMKNNNLSNIQYALEKALLHDNIKPCAKPMIKDYCYSL